MMLMKKSLQNRADTASATFDHVCMTRQYSGGFRNLIAWQEAKKLTLKVYAVTRKFPRGEQFHIISQLRRAASSVMANIAEGSAMQTKPHRGAFYTRASDSTVEVDNFIELSFELSYLTVVERADLQDHCARLSYLLTRLIKDER